MQTFEMPKQLEKVGIERDLPPNTMALIKKTIARTGKGKPAP